MSRRQGQPYSQDMRERVLGALDGGMAVREVAALFGVSLSWIYKAQARRRLTGETGPRAPANRPTPKLAPYYDALRAEVAAQPDATLHRLRAWLLEVHGVSVSVAVLWTTLQRLSLPLKQSRVVRFVRPARPLPFQPNAVPPAAE